MPNNCSIFRDKSKRFLYTTALAMSLSILSNPSKAATELDGSNSYGPTDGLNGFSETNSGTTDVTFTTSEGQYFYIGAISTPSLTSNSFDSSTLNVYITNGGGSLSTSGIIFEDDIVNGSENAINLNINDGNVTFRGNVGNYDVALINITAGNNASGTHSILNFQNADDESLDIFANIKRKISTGENILDVNLVNNSENDSNSISFGDNLGYDDGDANAFINTLTIGDSGAAKTNNVIFNGEYLNTNNINIGVDGEGAVQTHNITLQTNLREIRGEIYGRAEDNITITKNNSADTLFYGSVSNIDNIFLDGGSASFKSDVNNSKLNVNRSDSLLAFGSDDDNSPTYVNSEIAILGGVDSTIRFGKEWSGYNNNSPVNFSGSITAESGSNTSMDVWGNSVIGSDGGGNITFSDGNDIINSYLGYNVFASAINFGADDDTFNVDLDSVTSLTGSMTNLENINIVNNSALVVYQGGSYTGNVNGDQYSTLVIGGFDSLIDETATTYNSVGTVDTVALQVGGAATFNTNGHSLGSDTALAGLYVYDDATFNIEDNVRVIGNGTSIYNNGTIQIGAGAILTTNTFENNDSGTLIFDIASPSSAGLLDVTNQGVNLTSLTVKANLTGADSLFQDGNQIKVAQGNGALTGTDGNSGQEATQITENSALFSIRMMDGSKLATPANDSDLYLVFSQDATVRQIADGSNNKNVGNVFDGLTGTSNPELSEIITKINAASKSELESILESTTTDVGGGVVVGSQNFVNNTLDITSEQINLAMNYKAIAKKPIQLAMNSKDLSLLGINSKKSFASGEEMTGLRTWGQTFFEDSKQGLRKGIAGFDSSTRGFVFGADTTELFEGSVAGVALSYGNTKVKSNNRNNSRNKIDSYQITAYGSHNLPSDYFIKAMVAYAQNKVDSTRYNVGDLGLNAQSKYNADLYTVRSDLGKDFKIGTMRFTPSLLAHYSHYDAENYTETGAGGASLNVKSKALEIFELGTNLELGWDYKLNKESSLSPEIRVGYRNNLIGDKFRTNSSFSGGGSSFDTIGSNPARTALTLGSGLIYKVTDRWDISLNYEYEHRQDFNSNSGFARAAYSF
jgi:uncharacterized protein with beta-barrel porin domain